LGLQSFPLTFVSIILSNQVHEEDAHLVVHKVLKEEDAVMMNVIITSGHHQIKSSDIIMMTHGHSLPLSFCV